MADPGAARRQRAEASAPRGQSARGQSPRPAGGRGSAGLDNLIHHRIRLGIVSALAAVESLTFNELKALLEEADYVTCTKSFDGRRPRTEYRLTPVGRRELTRYLSHMEALIRATRDTLRR